MTDKTAKANVEPVRQRTQYSCMAASMAMCLRALDHDVTEDEVNRVMGARPMKGAAWEQALATAQHYGCRATLTMPATVEQLKAWTDAGVPVMIAWNPEGRDWSHASVVFDVDDDLNVYVADPNLPNPKKTVRTVTEDDFYAKWYEKFPDYLVRRPACAIEREITAEGAQVNILAGEEAKPVAVKLLASKTASLQFDRFYTSIDAIRNLIRKADDYRALDLAREHIPTYVQGGVKAGYLPRGFIRQYNKLTRGLGTAGLETDMKKSKKGYQDILDAMEKSARAMERGHPRTASSQETPAHQSVWAAWDTLQGVDKVREGDSFESVGQSFFLTLSIEEALNGTKYGRAAEKMYRKLPGIEKQTRSWRAGYNLWREGKPIDMGRMASDMGKTLASVEKVQNALVGMTGMKRDFPAVWAEIMSEFGSALRATNRAVDALSTAITMLNSGKAAGAEVMAGKKERQRAKDRAKSQKLKGQQPKGPKPKRTPDQQARAQAEWKARKEEGRAGLPGAGAAGKHRNKQDFARGHKRRPKHRSVQAVENVARAFVRMSAYSGNPDGKPIYPVEVDHGDNQALSGGFDVMKRLQDRYRIEQGHQPREQNPRLAADAPEMQLNGRRVKVNDAFLDQIKKAYPQHTRRSGNGGWALIHPDADKPLAPSQDVTDFEFYFFPSRVGGWWSVSYQPGYLILLQKAGDKMRAKTTRLASRGQPLDRATRTKANSALIRAKLDGNGRFRKPEQAYSKALDVLSGFGIELGEVVSSHQFQARPTGTLRVDLAFTNQQDSFSPVEISNSILYLQFTELRDGVFEAVAYLS